MPLFIINSHNTNKSLRFHGIDISVVDVFFAERLKRKIGINNFTFYVGAGECLPFNKRVFDIVICSKMLEHIKEPENCLKEIKRVLKDDGVCFVSTPNKDNFVTRLKSFFKKADKKTLEGREILNKEEHINVRGLKAWKQVFSSMGFTVEAIKRHGIIYGGYGYNKHRLLFAFLMITDFIFDYLPFMQNFSEGITYKLKIYNRHEK